MPPNSQSEEGLGRLQLDPQKFPKGVNYLVNTINALGLKVGIYSCDGTLTCGQHLASLNHEYTDAQTFADWGIEYLKYDYCFNIPILTSAPDISAIYVRSEDSALIGAFTAKDAILSGNAQIINYNSPTPTTYISGLSSKGGFATFKNLLATVAGDYLVTIYYKSSGYFELATNYGENIYATSVLPPNNSATYATVTMTIALNEGLNTLIISNPVSSQKESAMRQYLKMGNALKTASNLKASTTGNPLKEIYFSLCEWGTNQPWEWANRAGNCWRTTFDIAADWNNIMGIYNTNVQLYNYAAIGGFNDPDMLEVGNGSLTYDENKSHFTLWCMMTAPLILGNDIRTFINSDGSINTSNKTYQILTNKDLIAIDQDSKCIQCRIFNTDRNVDILVKPLFNNDVAICFFNKGTTSQASSISILSLIKQSYITLPSLPLYKVYDLWDKTISSTDDIINVTIPTHGVKAFRIGKHFIGELDSSQDLILNINDVLEISSSFRVNAILQNTGAKTIKNINVSLNAPIGFNFTPISTTIPSLATGEIFTAQWGLTLPSIKGNYNLTTQATFNYESSTTIQTITAITSVQLLSTPKAGDTLATVDWIPLSIPNIPVQINKSISGNPLTINGKVYSSGIGTSTNNEIKIFTGGKSLQFSAVIGIDDETLGGSPLSGFPSATFQIWGDGEKLYDSGIMTYKQSANVFLDLTTYHIITFKTINGKNGSVIDHCDWTNAYFNSNTPCT